jgi:cell division protein FtsI (penicillin-binding protein 3)
MLDSKKYRLVALALLALFWITAIWLRLFTLQILRYGELSHRAKLQQERTIDIPPRRGNIFDRNYHALAMTLQVDSVFADPAEMKELDVAVTHLSRVLQLDPDALRLRLQNRKSFVWIKRRVTAAEAAQVRDLPLRGIYLLKEPSRSYPQGQLAAHVLGFVDNDLHGEAGLEWKFNHQVEGLAGKLFVQTDARRHWFSRREESEPAPGDNLVLTLDETIQSIAETALADAMDQTHAAAGTVLVMDPHTGEILALANRPTFNPNSWQDAPREVWLNRAVNGMYEPGSTMKIVTLSAALEEGLTTPDEKIDCQMGSINVFGRVVHDHKKFGVLTTSEIMAKSSDVGSIKLGMRVGNERMYRYMRAFGLGEKTGVELPGEEKGEARKPSEWSKSSIGSIAMGQELSATPLQIAAAASVIADEGVWHHPHIVHEVVPTKTPPELGVQSVVQAAGPEAGDSVPSRRVISVETALKIRNMLQMVVTSGTGTKARLTGYTSAGKSGTAQKYDPNIGKYSPTDYVASFVGFAPVTEPVVTIAVILDSPLGGHHGGEVSAPVFKRVAEQVLAYREVRPDLPISERPAKPEKIDPEQLRDSLDAGSEIPSDVVKEPRREPPPRAAPDAGPGRVAPVPAGEIQAKLASRFANDASPVNAVMDLDGSLVAPDFKGKTARAVAETALARGLLVELVGSGVVRDQSPPPGGRLLPGRRMTVRLEH